MNEFSKLTKLRKILITISNIPKEKVFLKFKYFAHPDLSFSPILDKIKNEIEVILKDDQDIKMNLERFEVLKYFDDPNIALFKDQEFIKNIDEYKKIIKRNIGIYFNDKVEVEKSIKKLYETSPEYISTFLQVISYYKLDNKVDNFEDILLLLPNVHIPSLLQNKYLVENYPEIITDKLLKDPVNAELLINSLSFKSNYDNYYLPEYSILKPELINKLFVRYIKSERPNSNYLKHIYQGKFLIDIDTRVRRLANEAYEKNIRNLQEENGFSIYSEIEIHITKLENKLINIDHKKEDNIYITTIKIDKKWLSESLDYNTILQNMIYIFQLVDCRFRFSAIPNNESEGVFERSLGPIDSNAYSTSSVFKNLENTYSLVFMTYVNYLKQNDINILEVVNWYLTDFLEEEYGILNFEMDILDDEVPISVLNNHLHTQFQRIIKTYYLYSKYEEINPNEVDIETNKKFNELKSINGIKYVYLNNQELSNCAHLLFSDQSLLGILGKDNNFFINLEEKKIKYEDIPEHLESYIGLLLENHLIEIENGFLVIKSLKYSILKELFFKYTINYYWVSKNEKRIIDKMIRDKELRTSDLLLSEYEVDYFNYYLNDYFSNGVALRNKYSHGSTGNFSEEEHHSNYIWLCYLMVLFIIKMNEEFNYKFDF